MIDFLSPISALASLSLCQLCILQNKLEVTADIGFRASSVTANIADASESNADQLVVAAKHGFARLDRTTGKLSYIREVWDEQDAPGKKEL